MASSSRVLDIAEATRSIMMLLDFESLDKLLQVLQLDDSGRTHLQDQELWKDLILLHFKGRLSEELAYLALPKKQRIWSWTDAEVACSELQEFLRIGDERAHFLNSVSVVQGDIGKIQAVDGIPLDGLAFPTNSHLTNHYIGAAGSIFMRAGRGLNEFVSMPMFQGRRDVGSAVATPAFDAGVRRLIHCVGPRYSQENCMERLFVTYENVMHTACSEQLACIAIASISTGAMGIPAKDGAQFALRAIQNFVRANHWDGKVAIVCLEEHVLRAFETEYAKIVAEFNVMPAFPTTTPF